MASSNLKPATTSPEPNKPESSHRFPTEKVTAIARLKSFGGSFVNYRKASPPIVFPPPSWDLSDELLGNTVRLPNVALNESNFQDPAVDLPEPVSFAKKLRTMIESLPIPGTSSFTSQSTSPSDLQAQGDDGKAGSPVPPDMDRGLVQMLSSEDIMNGNRPSTSNEEANHRPGIWNILASLKRSETKEGNPKPGAVEEEEGGVMMYAPLEPKSDSQLELASSETIGEPSHAHKLSRKDDKAKENVVEKRVWVPSTTDLSLLTTWWGYRLYLPPPVMAKLDGTSLQATARAAMITAALKWLLDKIPILLVPVQFRPAVKMLKQLSPVVGYIGVFIAWSWDRVRACDKGNGVVLTATWLLPVALLPMTWDAGDIYGPIAPPTPEQMLAAAETQNTATDSSGPTDKNTKKDEKRKSVFSW